MQRKNKRLIRLCAIVLQTINKNKSNNLSLKILKRDKNKKNKTVEIPNKKTVRNKKTDHGTSKVGDS